MVLVDGVKYACQQCIKGHRSSKCTHSTRPLTEIRSPSLAPSLFALRSTHSHLSAPQKRAGRRRNARTAKNSERLEQSTRDAIAQRGRLNVSSTRLSLSLTKQHLTLCPRCRGTCRTHTPQRPRRRRRETRSGRTRPDRTKRRCVRIPFKTRKTPHVACNLSSLQC
jgi:hypothetical protein